MPEDLTVKMLDFGQNMYRDGKIFFMNPEMQYKIVTDINEKMKVFRRDLAKKFHASYEAAKETVLTD